MIGPRCGGRMKVVAFLTEHAVVDRIIRHLELTFVAEKSPPAWASRPDRGRGERGVACCLLAAFRAGPLDQPPAAVPGRRISSS